MIILPPRRDSEKDTLANYTTGAAVEKKIVSIFQFFLCFTHTPLNGIHAGFPAEPSLVLKIRSLVFLSICTKCSWNGF